jgi:hypothetical protein
MFILDCFYIWSFFYGCHLPLFYPFEIYNLGNCSEFELLSFITLTMPFSNKTFKLQTKLFTFNKITLLNKMQKYYQSALLLVLFKLLAFIPSTINTSQWKKKGKFKLYFKDNEYKLNKIIKLFFSFIKLRLIGTLIWEQKMRLNYTWALYCCVAI